MQTQPNIRHALVVEPDWTSARILVRLLEKEGLVVHVVDTIDAAAAWREVNPMEPALCIVDGDYDARWSRVLAVLPDDCPVAVLGRSSDLDVAARALLSGAAVYFAKPLYKQQSLRGIIKGMLSARDQELSRRAA